MIDLAILGAGPAGLYAGLLAARKGLQVSIIEKGATVGGLASSFEVAGVSVDHGSHRLHPSIAPEILSDLTRMLGPGIQTRPRNGRIRLGDGWLGFPLSARDLIGTLSPLQIGRLAAGALVAGLRPHNETTLETAIVSGLGRPFGELFYFPYARKIWGVEPGELSGEQARRRISAASPGGLIRKVLTRGTGRTFLYPAGGFGQIPEAVARAAREEGANVHLNAEVVGLRHDRSGWVTDTAGGEHRARLVMSTLPITLLARLLEPPGSVRGAVEELRFRSMVLVYFLCSRDRYTEYDAHYFPGEEVGLTRLSEPKNYRDHDGDPSDRTVVCAEVPCWKGDAIWRASDEDLGELVSRDLGSLGLPHPGKVATVRRVPFAYPVYARGFETFFDLIDDWLGSFPGLLTFGRQGLFAHDNTHHALAMASEAVATVTDMDFDLQRWRVAREGFRHHVVED